MSTAPFEDDPALYIFTSLTAGSSHIVTATSRLETILRANRVPFKAVDIATDEKARRLWTRRAGKDEGGRIRKLPGLMQEGFIVGVSHSELPVLQKIKINKQHVEALPSIGNAAREAKANVGNSLRTSSKSKTGTSMAN